MRSITALSTGRHSDRSPRPEEHRRHWQSAPILSMKDCPARRSGWGINMADTTAELTDEQWRQWAREHKVCYELRPLIQKDGDELVQVGFEFEIAARLPKAGGAGE